MSEQTSAFRALLTAAALLAATAPFSSAASWEDSIPPFAPGTFAEPRALKAQYTFGWNSMTAATAELHFHRVDDRFVLEGTARTVGLVRTLWKFDVQHASSTDARTLRPVRVKETEDARSKHFETEVDFTPERVTSRRLEQKNGKSKMTERHFDFPNVMSLNSALLYLRSKPLSDGETERVVVYPATTPYLCTVTVLGHEPLSGPTGSYNAIKLEVKLDKIGKEHDLKPHKKFKHATVWLSNDADRLILRIESQIFLGTVFAELQSVRFEPAKP